MERNLNLTIPTPCHEKWENFSMTTAGGFCSSCNKTVADLTKMSDKEVLKYLQEKTSHTCVRTRRDQLKTYSFPSFTASMLFKAAAISLFLLMINKPSSAQIAASTAVSAVNSAGVVCDVKAPVVSVTIKGVVKAEDDGQVVPGVYIHQKGTTVGTLTDVDGKFEFPAKLNGGDVLVFSFVGYQTIEYAVTGNETEPIAIVLSVDSIIMGELVVEQNVVTEKTGVKGWWEKVKAIF